MKTTTILLFMLFTHLICFSQNKTFKWFEGKNVYEGTYDNNKHTKEEINQCYLLSINRYFEINTFFIEYVYSDNDYINRCKQIKNHLKYIDSIYDWADENNINIKCNVEKKNEAFSKI